MRMLGTAILVAASVAGVGSVCAADEDTLDLAAYQLTFEDEFDELDVSAWGPGTTWIAHTPWSGDFGDAKFTDPRDGFPFTVEDGVLRIEMRRNADGKWQSGLLASVDRKGRSFAQKYGYFEMRAKFPAGEGVWPAFWLIGVDRQSPNPTATAEIDIVEHYGHAPDRFSSSVHVWPIAKGVKKFSKTQRTSVPAGSLSEGFNLYGASVDEDKIRFYFNRRKVWEIDTPEAHKQPMFILVDLGLGAGWPTENAPDPSYMWVDYVRAYARE